MADWENKVVSGVTNPWITKNPNQTNEEATTPIQSETNLNNSNSDPQKSPDFTELFSENISDQTIVVSESINTSTENNQPIVPENTNKDNTLINDKEVINGPTFQVDTTPDTSVNNTANENIQQPQTNNENITEKNQETWDNTAKEKLLKLIKTHESIAQKKWFTIWIFSGVVLTACILGLTIIFAKEQIINLLNNWAENNIPITANILDLENENNLSNEYIMPDEEITDVYEIDSSVDESETTTTEEDNNTITNEVSDKSENNLNENNGYITDENNQEIIIKNETENNEDITENSEDITENNDIDELIENNALDNVQENENITPLDETNENTDSTQIENTSLNQDNTEIDEKKYKITRVSSTWDANWVLPAACGNDIFCNNTIQTFTPCERFRLNENMSDDANRIGNTWTCRYKNISELVHVDFE